MAETLSKGAKKQIIKKLREQGYATYARLLDLFDVYLTDDPNHVAYMIPGKAKVVFNKDLSIDQVSTLARHEILHEYFTHMQRQGAFHKNNPNYIGNQKISNIAGDFEISNRGYTDADKATARSIKLNGKILKGLVTDLDRPGWEDLTFEEMYKRLLDENEMTKDKLQDLLDRISQLNPDNLDDMEDQADQMSGQGNSNGNLSSDSGEDSHDQSDQGNSVSGKSDASDDEESNTGVGEEDDNADKEAAKQEIAKQAQQLSKAIEDIKDKAEKGGPSDPDTPFKSDKDMRDEADVAARVAQIDKMLKDLKLKETMLDEVNVNKQKERAIRAARNIARYNKSGIQKFKLALNRFIDNQLSSEVDATWTRIHPSYEDSEFIFPGKKEVEEKRIPLINVYWDVSGSFDDPKKTASARQAIATLNQYVRNGDIEIDTYYFADRVSDNEKDAGGGTNGQPILNHILGTHPDNVIVITDGDIGDCRNHVQVPGAVWMLFYDTRSQNLIDHLSGKKETKYFDIDYR